MSLSEQATLVAISTAVAFLVSGLLGWAGRYVRQQFREVRAALATNSELQAHQLELGEDVKTLQVQTHERLDRQNGSLRTHDTSIISLESRMSRMEGQIEGVLAGILEGKVLRQMEHGNEG